MVGGRSVLQGMRAARVLRDVPTNRARLLTRRVGRVKEPVLGHRRREVGVHHPRLNHRNPIVRVHRQDRLHPRQLDHDTVLGRMRPARQASPRAARHEVVPALATRLHHRRHLLSRLGQHHRHRPGRVQRKPITLVNKQLLRPREDPVLSHHQPKPVHNQRHHETIARQPNRDAQSASKPAMCEARARPPGNALRRVVRVP